MFTDQELAKAKRISDRITEVLTKEATATSWSHGYQPQPPVVTNNRMPEAVLPKTIFPNRDMGEFSSNPASFRDSLDIAGFGRGAKDTFVYPAPRMTFGDTLGTMGRGFGKTLGNTAQALVGGHHGNGILHNLLNDAGSAVTGQYRSGGDLMRGIGKSFSEPLRRAAPQFHEAFNLTAAPTDYLARQAPALFNTNNLRHPINHLVDWITAASPK